MLQLTSWIKRGLNFALQPFVQAIGIRDLEESQDVSSEHFGQS